MSFNLKKILFLVSQVILIGLIWIFSDWISSHYIPYVPSAILGILLLLFLLFLGFPIFYIKNGAYFLINNMILFFIPIMVSVVQYKQLFLEEGMSLLIVIIISTSCVLIVTAKIIDFIYYFFKKDKKIK